MSDLLARNLEIYEKIKANPTQGAMTQVAAEYKISRQRVHAIFKSMSKNENGMHSTHKPYSATINSWFTTDDQAQAFENFCQVHGMNHAAAQRQAVDLLIANPNLEGKEEIGPGHAHIGMFKTTQDQFEAFEALRSERDLSLSAAMRLAIQILLDTPYKP